MAGVGSTMFFKMLLVVTAALISAVIGEESVTVFTLKTDPVEETFNTSEHITDTWDNNEALHGENVIFDLVEKLGVANKQEKHSTFDEDLSEDFGSTSDFDFETTEDKSAVALRNFIVAPKACKPEEIRDRKGNCVKVVMYDTSNS